MNEWIFAQSLGLFLVYVSGGGVDGAAQKLGLMIVIAKKQGFAFVVKHFVFVCAIHQHATIGGQAVVADTAGAQACVITVFGEKMLGWLWVHEAKKHFHDDGN